MSRLRDRIAAQPAAAQGAADGMHPAGTADTPHVMPHVMVSYRSTWAGTSYMGVEQVLYAPNNNAPLLGAAGYGAVARAGHR